jgi:hypothetical protein
MTNAAAVDQSDEEAVAEDEAAKYVAVVDPMYALKAE